MPTGAAFRLEQLTAVELNTTTGLRLIVTAREHAGGLWFEEELPFDLNTQTYDVFDLLAVNDRFGAVDQVAITIESPNVDPVFGPYILDAVDITLTTPPCVGDLNDDLVVDLADLSTLLGHFGTTGGATLADGDLDGDDDVDLADLARFLTNFGRVCR